MNNLNISLTQDFIIKYLLNTLRRFTTGLAASRNTAKKFSCQALNLTNSNR